MQILCYRSLLHASVASVQHYEYKVIHDNTIGSLIDFKITSKDIR